MEVFEELEVAELRSQFLLLLKTLLEACKLCLKLLNLGCRLWLQRDAGHYSCGHVKRLLGEFGKLVRQGVSRGAQGDRL